MIDPIKPFNLVNSKSRPSYKQENTNANAKSWSEPKIQNLKKRCIIGGSIIAALGSAIAIWDYKNRQTTPCNYLLKTLLIGISWGVFVVGTYFSEKKRIINTENELTTIGKK